MHTQTIARDDPARTSDHGHNPWENRVDLETVSDHYAATQIAAAIANGGEIYGHSADQLTDILTNLHAAELRDFVLAVLFPEAYPKQAERERKRLKQKCGELANDEDSI